MSVVSSQPNRCMLPLLLLLGSHFRSTIAAIEIISLDDYYIVHDNESDPVFSAQEASDYCRTQFGTSLASYHTIDQQRNMTSQLIRTEEYWTGLYCEERVPMYLNGSETINRINQFAYKDESIFDFVSLWINELDTCLPCIRLSFGTDSNWRFLGSSDCDNLKISGLICNTHEDTDWQLMNPVKEVHFQCTNNTDCSLVCRRDNPCIYYTNHSLSDLQSLNVICSDYLSCLGLNISLSNSRSLDFLGYLSQRVAWASSFHIRSVSEVTMTFSALRSVNNAVFWIEDAQNFEMNSLGDSSAVKIILHLINVKNHTQLNCVGLWTCASAKMVIESSHSVALICDVSENNPPCYLAHLTANDVRGSLDVVCGSQRSCTSSWITLRDIPGVNVRCASDDQACRRAKWNIARVNKLSVFCEGYWACYLWDSGMIVSQSLFLSDVGSLEISCIGSDSCTEWWNPDHIETVSEVETLQIECDGVRSCDLLSFDEAFQSDEITVLCRSESSCGLQSTMDPQRYNDSNRTVSVNVVCDGFEACQRSEIQSADYVSDIMQWLWNMSSMVGSMSVQVSCDGRSACQDSLIAVAPTTELSVQCGQSDRSCDDAEINGFCAARMSVEIESDVAGLSVVCPNEKSGACEIEVKPGAQMKEGRIQMSEKDWRKEKNEIRGDSDAYSAVSTVHSTGDTDCSSGLGNFKYGSVECFLEHLDGTREWLESQVCRDFVLSLYSPISIAILAATFAFLCLFVLSAMHGSEQSDPFSVAFTALFSAVALSALCGSLALFAFELDVRSTIAESSTLPGLDDSFQWFAIWNISLFVMMLMSMQIHILVLHKKNLRMAKPIVCSVKMIQMLLVYLVVSVGVPVPIALAVCFVLDVLLTSLDFRFLKAWLVTGLVWFLLSQFSPMSLVFPTQRSFLQVIGAADSEMEAVFIWLDLVLIELALGFSVLIWTRPSLSQRLKVFSMFSQMFDYSTDIAVIVFWMTSQRYLWATLELSFVMGAAFITWFRVRNELRSWMDHTFVLCGLARGYCKMKVWDSTDGPWMWIDRVTDEMEMQYESNPSIVLGLYIVMSDWWSAFLNGDSIAGTASLGPLILSVFFSANSVALKNFRKSWDQIAKPGRLKIEGSEKRSLLQSVLFVFTLSDFLCRCIPICLVCSLSQGHSPNSHASPLLSGVFFTVMLVVVAEHALFLRYHQCLHSSLLLCPSVWSATPMFFACFPSSLHPSSLFPFHSFLRFHSVVLCQCLSIMLLCLIIDARILSELPSFCLAFLVSFITNALITLVFLFRTQVQN